MDIIYRIWRDLCLTVRTTFATCVFLPALVCWYYGTSQVYSIAHSPQVCCIIFHIDSHNNFAECLTEQCISELVGLIDSTGSCQITFLPLSSASEIGKKAKFGNFFDIVYFSNRYYDMTCHNQLLCTANDSSSVTCSTKWLRNVRGLFFPQDINCSVHVN